MKKLEIYILSRDRPDYLRQSIESALNQESCTISVEVIVSDNSEGNAVFEMMIKEFADIKYVRRTPTVSAFAHFKLIIQEAKGDLIVLFHDDDLMLSNYVATLNCGMQTWPTAGAVCCNAKIVRRGKITKELMVSRQGRDAIFEKKEEFLEKYLRFSIDGGCYPFPGYMYRRSVLTDLYLDPNEGGKYSDVSFLAKILERRPIVWLDQVCIGYRIHESNDSRIEEIPHRLRLLRYLFKTTEFSKNSELIMQYKYKYWFNWWVGLKYNQQSRPRIEKIIKIYLLKKGFRYAFTNKSFATMVLHKAIRKFYNNLIENSANSR